MSIYPDVDSIEKRACRIVGVDPRKMSDQEYAVFIVGVRTDMQTLISSVRALETSVQRSTWRIKDLQLEIERLRNLALEAKCPRSQGYSFKVEACFTREQVDGCKDQDS